MNDVNTDEIVEQPKVVEPHGGNISALMAKYPNAQRPFIDLSTGINPYSYPIPPIQQEWIRLLPEAKQVNRVRKSAAQYYGLEDNTNLVIGSGMQQMMFSLACLRLRLRGPATINIVSPTYNEHARVWTAAGHAVYEVANINDAASGDVVVVCNPNNPDGRTYKPDELTALATQLHQRNAWLVVDESFMDIIPDFSLAKLASTSDNIVVFRSCGKFFGVAGLRVSCAIAWESCANWLTAAVGPWPISTAACNVLPAMFADAAWIQSTRTTLVKEAVQWRGMLASYFTLVGFTPFFTLVDVPHAEQWYEKFVTHGIAVRRFEYNQRWLRIGLPAKADLPRLQATLAAGSAW